MELLGASFRDSCTEAVKLDMIVSTLKSRPAGRTSTVPSEAENTSRERHNIHSSLTPGFLPKVYTIVPTRLSKIVHQMLCKVPKGRADVLQKYSRL